MARRSERTPAFWTLAAILIPPFSAMAGIRQHHAERVPAEGAFVLAPNHYSEIDPLVMAIALWRTGRVPRFMAKASLFKVPIVGAALRATQQIPVDRAGAVRGADPMAAAQQLVDEQQAVIIYPEGSLTRDPDLWPMRGKSGAVRMALQADVPLIPAVHWGTQHLMPRYGKGIRPFPRKTIDVLYGEPLDLSAYRGKPLDTASLTKATEELMTAITKLLAELRGEQPPAERWNPSSQGQSETGRFE